MSLTCKNCHTPIDVEQALCAAPYAWGATNAIWHVCPSCKAGNHVRFQRDKVAAIEITGAPGPTWEYTQEQSVPGVECTREQDGLRIPFAGKEWFVKYR